MSGHVRTPPEPRGLKPSNFKLFKILYFTIQTASNFKLFEQKITHIVYNVFSLTGPKNVPTISKNKFRFYHRCGTFFPYNVGNT